MMRMIGKMFAVLGLATAVLFMMPDRPDAQIGFLNTKRGLGFRELDVGLPKLFVSPIMDVAA